ncbi:hypothetical protein ACFQZJ_06140 [Maribacter chungangensis]|uniref:Uncharacterized protein n=1 Tax=Maribacter chungangensis TaxID=1069117 RepID=A0ABW3B2D0_9FLAO
MKTRRFTAVFFTTLFLISCGSSMERDAKKMVDLQCKVEKLQQKAFSGDMSNTEEMQELIAEAAKMKREMNEKYSEMEEKASFAKILMQTKSDCN